MTTDKNTVLYRDEKSGQQMRLDLRDGRVYDLAGNQIDKWTPADDSKTAMLSDYVHEMAMSQGAYAMGMVDEGRARHMLASQGVGEESIRMDLGPSDVHIPSAMPNYASGYRNEPPIADMLAPPLPSVKQVDDFYEFDKLDAFQRAQPVAGAGGAQVPEISPRLGNRQFSTKERAVGGWVATQVEANADIPLRILQATTRRIFTALTIEREIRVATMLQTSGNWDSGQVATLGAGAKWNGGASSDPVKDIHDRIEASWGGITGMAMSERLWNAFVRNPVVKGYTAFKDKDDAIPTPAQIQAALKLPPIWVGKMKYATTAGTVDYVWGNHLVLFRQPDEMPPVTQDDVATAVTFRWTIPNPKDGVASGGFLVRQFFVQDRGSMGGMKIVVVHHDAEVMTSKWVGGLVLNAYQ